MAENPENPQTTSMDRKVDQRLEPTTPAHEKYNPTALGNLPLADSPEPLSEQEPTKLGSWTIAELERVLSTSTLKPSSIKLDQFSQTINRKQDLRMRNLSRQLGAKIKADQEASDPAKAKKLSEFDLQSQTMRMVNANAAMGSYQFQKTLVLPYMRKNLALGYQKVSLLKEVVKAIQSSEKSLVSKLEAIKINTSSAAPRQKSYFKRLMDDVSFLNMRRIAGNLSANAMNGYEKLYDKYVTPATTKMYRMMSSDRKQDGVNGVRRTLTGKLNSWRRTTRDFAKQDFSGEGRIGKIKATGASIASRILGGTVKNTQKIKFGDSNNKLLTTVLKGQVEDIARLNPFSSKGPTRIDVEEGPFNHGAVTPTTQSETIRPVITRSDSTLQTIINDWRLESRKSQDKVIHHLSRIDDGVNGRKTQVSRSRGRVTIQPFTKPTTDKPTRPSAPSVDDIMSSLDTPTGPRSLGDQLSGPVKQGIISEALPDTPASQERKRTSIGGRLAAMRTENVKDFGSVFKKALAPLYQKQILAQVPQPITSPAPPSPFGDRGLNRSFFTSMFERLGVRVTNVSKTVEDGNKDRTKFEKIQSKWKEIADKLRPKEIRKNSYEDIQAHKGEKPKGLLGRAADRVKNTATSAGSKLLAGDVVGAGGDVLSDLFGWAKDEATEAIGDKVKEAAEERLGRVGRRGRIAMRRLRRGGVRGVLDRFRGPVPSPAEAGGRRTLGRRMMGGLGRGAVGAGRLGGRLALRGGAGLLKGGLSLAKGVGPAALAGLAGGYANDWFDKNTTGATKRLGTTASTAASWGATGATIGSIVPGIGTGIGGALGATAGVIAANTDLIGDGLSKLAKSVSASGDAMWESVFGKDAKLDGWGKVKEQEKPSLIKNMYGSIFGLDAKYAKSGDIVRPGTKGLIPSLKQGVDKFFFGDKNKDGKFKAGSSILAMMGDSVMSSLDTFKQGLSQLPGQILELFGSLKEGASGMYNDGKEAIGGAYEKVTAAVGNIFKGKAKPVDDAKSIVQELVPNARITSHRRSGGGVGKAGGNSWHNKSGAAVDVAPVAGMDFETFKRKFTDAGYPLIEAIDETNPETMKKTGATGPHWHIVLGQRTASPNASAGYQGPNGGATWGGAMAENSIGGGTGPLKGGYVSKDAKQLFGQAVAYLQKKGWNKTAAMGIAANLFGESGLNTKAFNGAGGGQGAQGIAQWRGDRIKGIEAKFGKPLGSMSLYEQLDAVDWELRQGKHVSGDKSIANGTTPIVDALNNAPNMEQVVQQMVYRYERPAANERASETRRRINEAYGLAGAAGQGDQVNKPKTPAQQVSATAKPTTNKKPEQAAQAKPKLPPKPATTTQSAPSPVTDTSFVDKIDKVLNKWEASIAKSGSGGGNNTVISSPVSIANRTASNNATSVKKERIRTGA